MAAENVIDLKNRNLKSIIDHLRGGGAGMKRQMAQQLGLSFATVSNMTNLLAAAGVISESENEGEKSVGRAPKAYVFTPGRFTTVVVDMHLPGTLRLYQVDLGQRVLAEKQCTGIEPEDTGRYLEQVGCAYADFVAQAGVDTRAVIGVGAIIPGVFDNEKQVVAGTIQQVLGGQPLRRLLAEATGKPVLVENDANLAAMYAGHLMQAQDMVYVLMDTGMGIGVLSGGNILRNTQGYSSEIAHAPLGTSGRVCPYCGNSDCLQTDMSHEGYLEKYRPGNAVDDGTWAGFCAAVEAGDKAALAAVQQNAALLGRALATVAGLVRPETIMVGGLPGALAAATLPACEAAVNARRYYSPHIRVLRDENLLQTMALGAAEMVYRAWLPDTGALLGE